MTGRAGTAPTIAATFTDLSSESTVGLPWRSALKICRRLGVPVAKVGRRCVVRTDAWLAAIDRAAGIVEEPKPSWSRADVVAAIGGRR